MIESVGWQLTTRLKRIKQQVVLYYIAQQHSKLLTVGYSRSANLLVINYHFASGPFIDKTCSTLGAIMPSLARTVAQFWTVNTCICPGIHGHLGLSGQPIQYHKLDSRPFCFVHGTGSSKRDCRICQESVNLPSSLLQIQLKNIFNKWSYCYMLQSIIEYVPQVLLS